MLENRRKSHLHIFGAKPHKQDAKLRGSGWSGVVRDTLPHNKKCEGFQISHFLILSYALLPMPHNLTPALPLPMPLKLAPLLSLPMPLNFAPTLLLPMPLNLTLALPLPMPLQLAPALPLPMHLPLPMEMDPVFTTFFRLARAAFIGNYMASLGVSL